MGRYLVPTYRSEKTNDPEIPAYVRKNENEQPSDKVRRPSVTLIEEEEFEVPAFLRRQAD
jgi:hypothetical protein